MIQVTVRCGCERCRFWAILDGVLLVDYHDSECPDCAGKPVILTVDA